MKTQHRIASYLAVAFASGTFGFAIGTDNASKVILVWVVIALIGLFSVDEVS